MKHVFVESNWVVLYAGPEHRRVADAVELVDRAKKGELKLYVPSICIREGGNVLRRRGSAGDKELATFARWAVQQNRISVEQFNALQPVLAAHGSHLESSAAKLDERLDAIRGLEGVEVFALTEAMLERAIGLRNQIPDLKPFDEAILAAVLVRASELPDGEPRYFCSLDKSDLGAVAKKNTPRPLLKAVYDEVQIQNRADFLVPA